MMLLVILLHRGGAYALLVGQLKDRDG
jgi:hypothetical protein